MADTRQPRRFETHAVLVVVVLGTGIILPLAVAAASSLMAGRTWYSLSSPFGTHQLFCVHLLAAIPVGWLLARSREARDPKHIRWVSVLSAAITLCLTYYVGLHFDAWLPDLDVTSRWLVRSLWSFALILPWCLLASSLDRRTVISQTSAVRAFNLACALAVALLLPRFFALDMIRKQSAIAEELMSLGQLARAERVIQVVAAIGSEDPILGAPVNDTLDKLQLQIAALDQQLATPLLPDATIAERFEYANLLYATDQLPKARDLLIPFAKDRPDAALMLAGIHDDLGEVDRSIEYCQRCLNLLVPRGDGDPLVNELREQAYARMAVYLRKDEQFKAAETLLQNGLQEWSASRGFLNLQLAQHYHHGGRPFDAIRHYQLAANADPRYEDVAQAAVTTLQQTTPVCILRPSSSLTR